MSDIIPRFLRPELVFGFVAPIGADLTNTLGAFREFLQHTGYIVEEVKVTDAFKHFREVVKPKTALEHKKTKERYETHIAYGNQLREHFKDDSILAATSIVRLQRKRLRSRPSPPDSYQGIAYLVYQFKRKEEVDLFRTVYRSTFFQVSVYSRRGARVDYLARRFGESANSANFDIFRSDAESIVGVDERENNVHGQRVAEIFHEADFIVNLDVADPSITDQVHRFCELVFGSNSVSPGRMEYGMFLAQAAALRTLDLSRQVGAAIFDLGGEVITLGSNEVPKAGGGTYWPNENFDDRDYRRQIDSNDQRKRQILRDIIENICPISEVEERMQSEELNQLQLMDALEYGRCVHAEMLALSDAARLGRSVKGSTLYSTTFPCHLCTKHIVASGIARVVFLEPYPKSLAIRLHADSIQVEGADRGPYASFPAVVFEHFCGVTPRRYRELFARGKRKDREGVFLSYIGGVKRPVFDVRAPFYAPLESVVVDRVKALSLEAHDSMQAESI